MQGQLNNSPHSSFLQQECVSCAYMAEEGHSLVSGLTALHWETAKICLKPAFLLPGEAGSRGFLISWYLLQHAERRGGLKLARCGRVEMPPLFSASLPQPKAAHMQMLEPFHQLCPSRSPRGRTPKWLPGPEEHNILWKHSRVPLLTSSPILDSCIKEVPGVWLLQFSELAHNPCNDPPKSCRVPQALLWVLRVFQLPSAWQHCQIFSVFVWIEAVWIL